VRELPAERQDMAGELLLTLATNEPRIGLTANQIEDLQSSIADVERGHFADEREVAETWKKFGL
jgi:hypothetical protein